MDNQIEKFLSINTSKELSEFLDISYSKLIYSLRLIKDKNLSPRYVDFQIPKKTGGFRHISSPNKLLLKVQRNLKHILSQIYRPPKASHGFINKQNTSNNRIIVKTIITNANAHKNKKVVLNIDLKDFFPSITGKRIFTLFTKPPFNFNKQVAGLLTEICIHDKTKNLPQGAATSPIISNMICVRLDKKLTKLAQENFMTYTRYADDLTFSSSKDNIDDEIMNKIIQIIQEEGFEINEKKLRIQPYKIRQEVTGLIVNKKVNVERKYIRNIRAMLHNWEVKGLKFCQQELEKKYRKKHLCGKIPDFENVLRGMINFIGQVRGKDPIADKSNMYQKFMIKFLSLKYSNNKEEFNKRVKKISNIQNQKDVIDFNQNNQNIDLTNLISFLE